MNNRIRVASFFLVLGVVLSSFTAGEKVEKNKVSVTTNISNEDIGEVPSPGATLLNNLKKDETNVYRKRRDTFGYTHGSVGTTFIDISGTGTDTGITTDDGERTVIMSFEFDFYGTVSRNLRVGANGAILFDATSGNIDYTNLTFPNAANPLMIAPYWDDLVPETGGIYYETQGTAPNRSFIIQWEAVDAWPASAGTGTFEVILYEGTNNIDFVYDDSDFNGGTHDDGESATVGINRDGTDAELNSFNDDDGSVDDGLAIRFTHPDNAVGMSYTSSTTFQQSTGIGVATGATQQQIISVEILVDGNSSALSTTNFNFNSTGTTDAANDIQNARLYYTGTSPDFATDVQFGSTVASPSGTFSIASTQSLVNGTNYFWLSYDIQGGATDGNFVDAECTSITIGSARTPTVTDPTGNREIGAPAGLSCTDAFAITPSCGATVTVNGTTTGGDTSDYGTCTTAGNSTAKAWHTFTGNGTSVIVTTNDIGSVLNDTKIWVFSGACGALTCIDGNDDTSELYSSVTFTATEGVTYQILVGGYSADDVGDYQLDVTFGAAMTFTSSTTTQNTSATIQSATDVQVIGVEIVTADNCDPIDLTSLIFNTTGSTDATNDIDNAKVYYTGTSSTFATTTQLGSTQANPNGTFTVTGFTQAMSSGTNYVWLAYDIAASATDENVVDAECTSIMVDGGAQTPSTTVPTGSRAINPDATVLRGNQLEFDGGDYLEAIGYTGISGSNDRTIEMWLRSNENSTSTLIHWGQNNSNGRRWRVRKINNAGTATLRVDIRNQDIETTQTGDFIDIDDGSWHHVSVVLNGTTLNDVNFYVDGMLQDKGANGTTVNTGTTSDMTIGISNNLVNGPYIGEMDEVRLWDDARTEDEIRENMHITLGGNEPGLVSYWQLNETSGTTFVDIAGANSLTRGDGSTTTTYPTIETSTVAVAGGVSFLRVVSGTGTVPFANTNIRMNFTVAPLATSDFVVYKLTGEDAPGNNPLSDIVTLNTVTTPYWVVRTFGATGYTTDVTFTLGNSAVSAADAATPSNLKLVSRSSNSFSTWSDVGNASSATQATGVLTFTGVTTFSQLKVGTSNNSALPITLKSFDGFAENGTNRLEWITSSEINNDYFELERSGDGKSFEVITVVNGSGTTSDEQQYSYIDITPYFGKNYYRLRQIDFDGQSDYSDKIVLLENNNGLEKLQYVMYPNPTDRSNINLNINSPDADRDISIRLFDIYGRQYYNQRVSSNQLNTEFAIETDGEIQSGMYLMVVEQGDQKVQKKLIIE